MENNDPFFKSFPDENMVFVEAGSFLMGAQKDLQTALNYNPKAHVDQAPVHKIMITDYYIGKYPITQAQWKTVMGKYFVIDFDNLFKVYAKSPQICEQWEKYKIIYDECFVADDLPVVGISYCDILSFIKVLNEKSKKNYRLPTEAEWEFAARGGNKSRNFLYSGSNCIDEVAWYCDNSDNKIHPVGTKLPNELGLYDMSGNVWNWCCDTFNTYKKTVQKNPCFNNRVGDVIVRGGGYNSYDIGCFVSTRDYLNPTYSKKSSGFRLVLSDIFSPFEGIY